MIKFLWSTAIALKKKKMNDSRGNARVEIVLYFKKCVYTTCDIDLRDRSLCCNATCDRKTVHKIFFSMSYVTVVAYIQLIIIRFRFIDTADITFISLSRTCVQQDETKLYRREDTWVFASLLWYDSGRACSLPSLQC